MENHFSEMLNLLTSFVKPCLIGCAVKYDIVDHLLEKEMDSYELSMVTKTNQPHLQRLLSGLVDIGVLKSNDNEKYSVTKFGETLKTSDSCSLKYYTKTLLAEQLVAVSNLWYSVETGGTAFEYAYGKPFYEFLAENTDTEYIFSESMREFTNITYNFMVPVYDFSSFRKIVDVGGGDGSFMRCILTSNINATGIVFDRPTVIQRTEKLLTTEFGERCDPISGDFLVFIPSGGDCYIIKHVLFNCNDEKALKLLQNIRQQMNANTKLLIIEPMYGREYSLSLDIIMMTLMGGKLRHFGDYQKLLTKTGLRLNRKVAIPQFMSDIIEVTVT